MTKLGAILDQVDSGTVLLPEFQRGYVWNRDQVRGLMRSLYLGYPVGSLLVWETETDSGAVRGPGTAGTGSRLLLLDGQQRITSLYGVIRGRAPAFFEGDPAAFTGLWFNVAEETFEFYAPLKMKDDPRWIDVTTLFVDGLGPQIARLSADPATASELPTYLQRLAQLHQLQERDFHEEKITGRSKTVDIVVDIFNRVNSGGTKLSKGDLALAKVCAQWPDARSTMRAHLAGWSDGGYSFSLDWLLRITNALVTGRAPFAALDSVTADLFRTGLDAAARCVGNLLDVIQGRLGLDHDRVLMGRYAFPVIARHLHLHGVKGGFADQTERDRMLFWYIHSSLWGRFAGSTETVLTQDYETVERGGVDALITALERWRGGNLAVDAQDFEGLGRGSRFYPLLYLLTRVGGARDFGSGLELKAEMLGYLASLQVHHIFPKALLYKHDYPRSQVNAVGNFCFLTQSTNLAIGKRPPSEYLPEVAEKHPGALESQWIPTDPDLWLPERYLDFLDARRQLLAEAANAFLTQLRTGAPSPVTPLGRLTISDADGSHDQDAATPNEVSALVAYLRALGYATPATDIEISDPETGRALAVAEAFWPDGLQPGQDSPVVLELDPQEADLDRLNELGYQVFTSIDSLTGYAHRRSHQAAGEPPDFSPGLSHTSHADD